MTEEDLISTEDTELLKALVLQMYSQDGYARDKEFISSQELVYQLSETIDVDIKTVSCVLQELNFCTKLIDNVPCWVMYQKN